MREGSFGEKHKLTFVDKLGVSLSNRSIINYVKNKRPERIIDIGCGFNALLLRKLKKYSKNLTGADLSVNKEIKGIKFYEKDINYGLSFLESSSADLIIMNSVLEHLTDPELILKEAYRILDKNGTLIVNVPNWLGKYFLEFSAFKLQMSPAEEMNDHKMYYSKREIWPLLVRSGFKPSKIKIRYHKLYLNTICYAEK